MKEAMKTAIEAVRNGMPVRAAAREFGVNRSTLRGHLEAASVPKPLSDAGYELSDGEMSPEDAWNEHKATFNRELTKAIKKSWQRIKRPKGAFCIFHSTDEHIDDNKTPLALLEADIKAARGMNAVMCHGGDLLNNWPMAGRLAKQWSEQDCTAPKALLRMQHFINMFKPDVWTDGNHEEMNPYLDSLIASYLPKNVIRDYWNVNFIVETPGGRDIRCIMSHKFQKGSSWFHPHHGAIREGLEGDDADVYMEGHIHTAGVMHKYLPEKNRRFIAVSSAGYKCMDKWATRISKGGKVPKVAGRSHFLICDPQADENEFPSMAFDAAERAEVYLNGLQNLRAI